MTRACQNVIFPLSHGKNMIWRRGTQQYQDQVVLRETFEGGVKLSSNDNLLFLKILFANNTLQQQSSVRAMQYGLDMTVNAKIPDNLVHKLSFERFRI